jgi:hypothetical protein
MGPRFVLLSKVLTGSASEIVFTNLSLAPFPGSVAMLELSRQSLEIVGYEWWSYALDILGLEFIYPHGRWRGLGALIPLDSSAG